MFHLQKASPFNIRHIHKKRNGIDEKTTFRKVVWSCFVFDDSKQTKLFKMKKIIPCLSAIMLAATAQFFAQVDQEFEVTKIRNFGGADLEISTDMALDSDGNQYIFGRFRGDFHDSSNVAYAAPGWDQAFLQKADINGNILWTKLILSTHANSGIGAADVEVDSDDNVFVFFSGVRNEIIIDAFGDSLVVTSVGQVDQLGNPLQAGKDLFLWKIDPTGNSVWAKTFGGNSWDNARGMAIDSYDNVIIVGDFQKQTNMFPNLGANTDSITNTSFFLSADCSTCYDGFITKLDNNGNPIWTKSVGGTNGEDRVYAVTVDKDNNIIVSGEARGVNFTFPGMSPINGGTPATGFVGKLSPAGVGTSINFIDGTGNENITNLTTDDDGNIYASGTSNSALFALDQTATILHNNAGITNGTLDAVLIKYDANLNYTWHHPFASSQNDRINDIFIHPNTGEVFAVGSVGFNLVQGGTPYATQGPADFFVSKLTPSGTLVEFSHGGGSGVDLVQSFDMHSDGTFVFFGQSETGVSFDVNGTQTTLGNAGNRDIFVVYGYDCDNFPTPVISLSANGDSVLCDLVSEGFTYNWMYDDGTGAASISVSTSSVSNALNGDYTVSISDAYCSSAVSNAVTVSGSTVGISDQTETSFQMYPNPAKEQITIAFGVHQAEVSIEIVDMQGRLVNQYSAMNLNTVTIPLEIPAGTYLVKAQTQQGVKARLFIKE